MTRKNRIIDESITRFGDTIKIINNSESSDSDKSDNYTVEYYNDLNDKSTGYKKFDNENAARKHFNDALKY